MSKEKIAAVLILNYLNFHKNHSLSTKKGTIITLIYQSKTICSTYEALSSKIQLVKKDLLWNEYPEDLITKTIKKYHIRTTAAEEGTYLTSIVFSYLTNSPKDSGQCSS